MTQTSLAENPDIQSWAGQNTRQILSLFSSLMETPQAKKFFFVFGFFFLLMS